MPRINKILVVIDILWLIVLLSFLVVGLSGCTKKSAETESASTTKTTPPKTTSPKTAFPDPSSVDLSKYLSSDEKLRAKLFADVNKDGNKEIIFLSGKPWDATRQDPRLVRIRILTWDGSKYISSWEQSLEGEFSEKLWAEDINKDSIVEILSSLSIGNSLRLYVIGWNGSSYRILKPIGGNSKDYFGPDGAEAKDEDNDGVKEIYAYYGTAGSQADIYKWDGRDYKFFKTASFPR